MTAKQVLKDLKKIEGVPILGWTLWWTIVALQITRNELSDILDRSLGSQWLPAPIRPKKALKYAMDELVEKVNQLEESGMLRKIRDDRELAAWALVKEVRDIPNLDIALDKMGVVVYDKQTRQVEFRGPAAQSSELEQLFSKYTDLFKEADIRMIVIDFIKAFGGLTLRETGGIYFLRDGDAVERLEKFFELINAGSQLYTLPLADNKKAKTQMVALATDELLRDVEVLAGEVQYLSQDDKPKLDTTFARRLDDLKQLRGKLGLYRDLLSNEAENITSKLGALEEEVNEALLDQHSRFPQASDWPYKCRVLYSGTAKDLHNTEGTVIGYHKNPQWVKVLFDKTNKVQVITTQLLKKI